MVVDPLRSDILLDVDTFGKQAGWSRSELWKQLLPKLPSYRLKLAFFPVLSANRGHCSHFLSFTLLFNNWLIHHRAVIFLFSSAMGIMFMCHLKFFFLFLLLQWHLDWRQIFLVSLVTNCAKGSSALQKGPLIVKKRSLFHRCSSPHIVGMELVKIKKFHSTILSRLSESESSWALNSPASVVFLTVQGKK